MKLISFLLIIFLLIFSNLIIDSLHKNNLLEHFSSSYNNCINSGYTKEFCLQTPTSVLGPNSCLCRNGSVGYLAPGFRGHCICAFN